MSRLLLIMITLISINKNIQCQQVISAAPALAQYCQIGSVVNDTVDKWQKFLYFTLYSTGKKGYRPEGPVGIRYKKQILDNRDQTSETFDSHMLEQAFKKRHFLHRFNKESFSFEEDFQLQSLCPSTLDVQNLPSYKEIHKNSAKYSSFCAPLPPPYVSQGKLDSDIQVPINTFMSTKFYKPKFKHFQSIPASAENMVFGAATYQTFIGEQLQEIPKDNQYIHHALGVKPSYELPIINMEQIDQQSTIEGFLFKKAKQNNIDNFHLLREAMGGDESKLSSLDKFQKYSFTYEDPEYIAKLTAGMKPIQIQKLKPQNSIFRYFTQEIEITPSKISFDECQLLIPKFEVIKISNKQRSKDVELKTIIASTPELTFYPPSGVDFPIKLGPYESIEIRVAYTSETLGLFEALMYLVVDEWIYVQTFNAYVVPNKYDIQPFYVTDLNINQGIELPLYITNPSSTDTLIIEEIYSTGEDVKLKWPHSGNVMSENLQNSDQSFIQHILVPEGSKKLIANMYFEMNRTLDFYVEIHIRTSLHDILRVPLYYHVHSDIIKFSPSVVDFGLSPLNFDILKVPIYAKSKSNEQFIIQDILLPMSDSRLDFQLVDISRNNIIKKNKEIFLGYTLLNPSKPGMVESKVILKVQSQRNNKTYQLEVPLIGNVYHSQNVFGAKTFQNMNDESLNSPIPLIKFDISDHLIVPQIRKKMSEASSFEQVILTQPLVLMNTFSSPISLKGVINLNSEFRILNVDHNGNPSASSFSNIILQPNEEISYAFVELNTANLQVQQSTKYISINVNNTLIPIAIAIFDRGLICVWDDQEQQMLNSNLVSFCTNPYELNFDYVAINDPKSRRLKITNLNAVDIVIETVSKQQLDDLNIYIEKVVDKNGYQINKSSEFDSISSILGPKRTKRVINFAIQPYQTLELVFQILAREPKQKFSRIDFQIKMFDSMNFYFNYKYHVIQGGITLIPQVLNFNPTYPGVSQSKPLIARSTFEVPVTIKAVTSNDFRIMASFSPVKIKANNKTEFGYITFDPTKQPLPINFQAFQIPTVQTFQVPAVQTLQIPTVNTQLKDVDLQTFINKALHNFDPMIQNSLMSIINGLSNQQGIHPQPQQIIHIKSNHQIQAIMSLHDIEQYREKLRIWDDISSQNEITTFVTIQTNVYQNITIPIRASLKKLVDQQNPTIKYENDEENLIQQSPQTFWVEPINFETVQIGTNQTKSIKIMNPTDEPIVLAIFLATNETLNSLQDNKNSESQNSNAPHHLDKDYFFQLYCGPKLKDMKYQALSNFEDLQIFLNSNENQKILCQKVQQLLAKVVNRSADDSAETLRLRLENYYKDMYISELQETIQQQNQNLIKFSQPSKNIKSPLEQAVSQHNSNKDVLSQIETNKVEIILQQQNQELQRLATQINQLSHAKPVDQELLSLLKQTYDKQKEILQVSQADSGISLTRFIPSFKSIYESIQNFIKVLQQRSNQNIKGFNITSGNSQNNQPYRYQEKSTIEPFRLKNSIMNDLIIKNQSDQLYMNQIKIADPFIVTYTGQNFFINPAYQGHVFKIDRRSNLTIEDAIIFQPQNLQQGKPIQMKLLLKNNLTFIHSVDISGQGGTGLLEVVKVLKRSANSDSYIAAPPLLFPFPSSQYPAQDMSIDYSNISATSEANQQMIRERIMNSVFRTDTSKQEEFMQKIEAFKRNSFKHAIPMNQLISAEPEQPNTIHFHITQDDIFINEDAVKTIHERVLVVQNIGNLPFTVESLFIDDSRCQSRNLMIENCQGFSLQPGEQHYIHLGYQTDYSIARLKRKLTLESKQGVIQEFQIQILIPVEHMQRANELVPLSSFEEYQVLLVKFLLLAVSFLAFLLVTKDILAHLTFVKHQTIEHEERIQLFEDQQQSKQGGKKIPQVLKDYISHDQIIQLYAQAQDKLQQSALPSSGPLATAGQSSIRGQQFLKEVSNLCSNKRTSACLEAQKQAIEVEKEQRRAQTLRHISYAQEIQQEKEQQQRLIEKMQRQQQQPIEQLSQDISDQQIEIAQTINKSKQGPKVSISQDQKESFLTDQSDLSQQPLDSLKEEKPLQRVPKISKKTQKELAQRLKEQQEAEERFKKQQLEKQKEAEIKRREDLKRQSEIKRKQEEDIKAMQMIEEQEKRNRDIKIEEKKQYQLEIIKAPANVNQSMTIEENSSSPLNSSRVVIPTTSSQANISHQRFEIEDKNENQRSDTQKEDSQRTGGSLANNNREVFSVREEEKVQTTYSQDSSSARQNHQDDSISEENNNTTIAAHPDQNINETINVKYLKDQNQYLDQTRFSAMKQDVNRGYQEKQQMQKLYGEHTYYQIKKKDLQSSSQKAGLEEGIKSTSFKGLKHGLDHIDIDNLDSGINESSKKQQLSKDDLLPFFESRRVIDNQQDISKIQQEQHLLTAQNSGGNGASSNKSGVSPNFNHSAAFVGSIFSYNPLSIFTSNNQESASNSKQTPENLVKTRQPESASAYFGQTHNIQGVSKLIADDDDDDQEEQKDFDIEEEENKDNEEDESQRSSTDLYNVFKSASSLFSRPLFGATTTLKQQSQKLNQSQPSFNQVQNLFQMQNDNSTRQNEELKSYEEIDQMSENEQEEERHESKEKNLFSGSLFGKNPPFTTGGGSSSMTSQHVYGQQNYKNQSFKDYSFQKSQQQQLYEQNALRRNQQSIHQRPPQMYQKAVQYQGPYSGNSMTYHYPPQPPPGLGYRPTHQSRSLYTQYSGGFPDQIQRQQQFQNQQSMNQFHSYNSATSQYSRNQSHYQQASQHNIYNQSQSYYDRQQSSHQWRQPKYKPKKDEDDY